jgi:hypothetical protein
MMTTDLTDRYVGATLRSIPQKQKADIEAELRASIGDAIEARVADGEDIAAAEKEVLEGLGDPDRLAAGYTGRPGYLIGPEHYFDYKRLLGVVMVTVVPIVVAIVAIVQVLAGAGVGSVFAETIGTGITLALHIAFWITLVFVVIERIGAKVPTAEWTLDGLPALPTAGTVRIGETIGTIVFLVFAIAAIFVSRDVSGLTAEDGTSIPFFDPEMWSFWFPYLVVVLALEMVFVVVKHRVGRWTWPLAAVNFVLNAAFAIPAIYLLTTEQIFNPEFFAEIGWGAEPAGNGTLVLVTSLVIGLIALWDVFDGVRKANM